MKRQIMKFVREEDGLTTVEYAIAGGLIGAAVIAAFGFLGDHRNQFGILLRRDEGALGAAHGGLELFLNVFL